MDAFKPLLPSRPSLRQMIVEGFWFCDRCEKLVQLPTHFESPNKCPRCRKPTARWMPPVPSLADLAQSLS